MRTSGRTTRLIDEAIQTLFNTGELHILKGHSVNALSHHTRGLPDRVRANMYDFTDSLEPRAQDLFIWKILNRLKTEHTHFEIKKKEYGFEIRHDLEAMRKIRQCR